MLMTAYGAGSRVSELCHLKVGDIDSSRMTIRVEQGKGAKDRYTLLSERLLAELCRYWLGYYLPIFNLLSIWPTGYTASPDSTGAKRIICLTANQSSRAKAARNRLYHRAI